MAIFDLPLESLWEYRPIRYEPEDFEAFWENTLAQAREFPLNLKLEASSPELRSAEVFDLTFSGYAGQPIKGWLLLPRGHSPPLPCVVEYVSYGGGRGFPVDWLTWSSVGYAHLVMDTRGQGSIWLQGDTPDPEPLGASPQHPGFLTRGIFDPKTYYYRRLITDAVRAVETARAVPQIDGERIALRGRSQGGGLALIVAGLVPDIQVIFPDVPFLCHFRRAVEITDELPYKEIAHFCSIHRHRADQVFRTLSYFDGVNFAGRAQARALFSVGLMDEVCPPSTVFAAYNYYTGPKDLTLYPYNGHDGGASHQTMAQISLLRELWS